jgi:hypothetical protein
MSEAQPASLDGVMAAQAKERDHQASQQRCILWRKPGARGVVILTQDGVLDPVQAVLDLPVPAHDPGEVRGIADVTAHVVPTFGVRLCPSRAGTLDLDEAGQFRPGGEGFLRRCSKDAHPTPRATVARTLDLLVFALRLACGEELRDGGVEVGLVGL